MNSKASPSCIWIHAPFRSGGTHIWNQFRAQSDMRCFYEPFNEILSDYHRGEFDQDFSQMQELMRHDTKDLEYFHEYPVDENGKIKGFHDCFAQDTPNNDNQEATQNYLQSLIDSAEGKTPVFKCCRSTFRAQWLKETFPSLSISILRDPFDQFQSFSTFPEKYFDACLLMQTSICGDDPRLQHLQALCPLPTLKDGSTREQVFIYQSMAQCLPEEQRYAIFYTWWWMHLLETAAISEVVIDINSAADHPELQQRLQDSGLPLDLEKCKPSTYPDARNSKTFTEIECWVEAQLLASHPTSCHRLRDALQPGESFLSDDILFRLNRMSAIPNQASPAPLPKMSTSLSTWAPEIFAQFEKLHSANRKREEDLNKKQKYIRSLEENLEAEKKRFLECERYAKSLEASRKKRWL